MVVNRALLALVASFGLLTTGCGGSNDSGKGGSDSTTSGEDVNAANADEHDHIDPKTVVEAIHVLEEMRDELATGFKNADVKEVDHAIHEMGPVVKKLKELIASSEMDQYDQKDAEVAAEQIMNVLGALHPSHGADAKVDPADYDAQADSLNDALENLEKLAEGDKTDGDS